MNAHQESSLGVAEFESLNEARKLLAGLPWAEVADFQFAYQAEKEGIHVTYFVSKWIDDAVRLDLYLSEHYDDGPDQKRSVLVARSSLIKEILMAEFADVATYNIMYCEKEDKLIVFDIHKRTKEEPYEGL